MIMLVLQPSLLGTGRLLLIATIRPDISCAAENQRTLEFARKALMLKPRQGGGSSRVQTGNTRDMALENSKLRAQLKTLQEQVNAGQTQQAEVRLAASW